MKINLLRAAATGLLATGLLGSCNNQLNVQPVSQIDAAAALNSSSDVQAALVGCYTAVQSANFEGGYVQFMSDLLANGGDELFVGTFSEPNQAQRKTLLVQNGTVANIWLTGYDAINRTNNVLANTGKLSTATLQATADGEARFLRSLVYFELVRLYGKAWNDGSPSTNPGVPLVLTPTTTVDASSNVARNTVGEVYTQLISDLVKAEAELPQTNGFFATRYAAAGLLARVYLQQGNYSAAAAAADRVISSGKFQLNTSYGDNFLSTSSLLPNSSEDIFAIQVSAQSGTNQLNTFYSQDRRADVNIQQQYVDLFTSSDERGDLNDYDSSGQVYYTNKYDVLYGNVKLLRLDEMYLIRAEANSRAGTSVGATPLADLNRIRVRAGAAPLVRASAAAIVAERRLELGFEGFALGDLKRTQGSTTDPITGAAIAWNSTRLVFPIPQRELNANPSLVQNAGY